MSRTTLVATEQIKCSECDFLINMGEHIVLGDWGWTHVLCSEECD